MTFSPNWEIRLVFPKGRHYGRIFFCYNPQNARKRHTVKEIFQSMTLYNTNKSPLRNAFFFVYHKLDWDMEEINRFGKIKVVNKYCSWVHASVRSVENCSSLEIYPMLQWLVYRQLRKFVMCDVTLNTI